MSRTSPPLRPLQARLRDTAASTQVQAAPARAPTGDALAGGDPSDSLARLNAAVAELRAQACRPYVFSALAAFEQEDLPACVALLLQALELDERCGPAWHLLAACRERQGDYTTALKAYETALGLCPDEPEIANDLGRLAMAMDMKPLAEQLFRKYLEMKPGMPDGFNNLACAQRDQLRFGDAVETLKAAIAASPASPVLWNTLGTVMAELGDLTNALTFFDESLRLDAGFIKARYNRSNVRLELGDAAGALDDCEGALSRVRVPAERTMMELARATMLLSLSRLEEGWDAYRVRHHDDFADVAHFLCDAPEWTPSSEVSGRRVLLFGEQGLGDEVLFANAVPDLLRDMGPQGELHLAVEPRLVPLFARSFPGARVSGHATFRVDHHVVRTAPALRDGPTPDLWAPIGALLRRYRPSVESFPADPAFLHPDPDRVAEFAARLQALGPGPKVGVVWRSIKIASGRHRFYAPFAAWEPVLRTPGVTFVSLQYGDASPDIAHARDAWGARIHELDGLNLKDDLEGVAALACALDLSIGPANASTNLAGASGAPTWLVSTCGAWPRLGTDHYPWYPGMRVFAPPSPDDWTGAMAEVARALAAAFPAG